MNISFENPDKINGVLTITVEETDYKESVEKTLKDVRKKANYPGFRPGMVPMGLIKKQYGASAKMDAINKLVGENIYKYMQENKIQMLGEPLPSEKQEAQDLEKPAPYTFTFEFLAPMIEIIGICLIIYLALTGGVNWDTFFVMFGAIFLFSVMLSSFVVFYDYLLGSSYHKSNSYALLLLAGLLEPIFYHPLVVYSTIRGYYNYLTRKKAVWGDMNRQGVKKKKK